MYSETSKPKTKESQKCHGRVRNLKILSKVLQTRLDKCVKKKASRKVQKHSDCYICFQYLQIGLRYFSRNLSGKCCNIFLFFAKLRSARGPSGAPLGPRGPRPPAWIGSKASWQIALRPHKCKYTWVVASGVRKNIL